MSESTTPKTEAPPKENQASGKPYKKRPLWVRLLKWIGITAVSIAALLTLIVSLIVWILTPERLTPLIEKYGSEYLTADLRLERAELTFWHTFPRLEVDLRELRVISRALDNLPETERRKLPGCTDSLLSVGHFSGSINILKMLMGDIAIHDVDIDRAKANIVIYNQHLANFNIIPPSEEKADTAVIELPDISLNRFKLNGVTPIRYFSLPDSIDATVSLEQIDVDGNNNSSYAIKVDGNADATVPPFVYLTKMPFVANGCVAWQSKDPLKISIDDFLIGAGPVRMQFSSAIDTSHDRVMIERLHAKLLPVPIGQLDPFVPKEYEKEYSALRTDMKISAEVELDAPYTPSLNVIPNARFKVDVPRCRIQYENLSLDEFELAINGIFTGDLNTSSLEIRKLLAVGEGMGFNLDARIKELGADPLCEGNFSGGLEFSRLPRILMSKVPATISGLLRGIFHFSFRPSYLSPDTFHRMLLDGQASLKNFKVNQSELGAYLYSHSIDLTLGTDGAYNTPAGTADSLLVASLKVDSLHVDLPGMSATSIDMTLGAGTQNRANSARAAENKEINPIGAVFGVRKLTVNSTVDSSLIRLRDVMAHASIKRYEGHSRVPLVTFSLDAGRMRYKDALTRVSFRETSISGSMHPRLRPQMSRRMGVLYDSIQAAHPHLRADSILALAQAANASHRQARLAAMSDSARNARTNRYAGTESLDYGVDGSTAKLLQWIDFKGRLTSKRARLFTPYFPVKNRLTDVDLTITPDSVRLRDTKYSMGVSDFLINGTISNLYRALTSKHSPIRINLDITSDTINVNEIAQAAFDGAAFADKISSGQNITLADTDNDELMQKVIEQSAAADSAAPLILPINVDARLNIRARNIIYSNLLFHNFVGEALLLNGALNLHELSASTEAGHLGLNALYTAPRKDDLSFAFGMDVKDFHIQRFMQLMPALDTIMPLMRDISGVINAEVAATTKVDPDMNLNLPSLRAAIKIEGDSLVLLDAETFRKIAKWLLFKDKKKNMVDHMEVQMVVENSQMELFPFIFNIDRYKLGVLGSNDLAMNFNYHISVLKSPIPFKFGINVKGNPDKMKIRLGRAKYKEGMAGQRVAIADTTRINLIKQIENVFRRGVNNARLSPLRVTRPDHSVLNASEQGDTISSADSLLFIREGVLPAPPQPQAPAQNDNKKGKRKK